MLSAVRVIPKNGLKFNNISKPSIQLIRCYSSESKEVNTFTTEHYNDDEFTPLELYSSKKKINMVKKEHSFKTLPPRSEQMSPTQDWGNVWPGPRSFHPAVVPLPIRQGYPWCKNPVPDKFANTELMKIPNFLHLTPPVIKRQCEALKQFCTPWPEELKTEADIAEHFPLEYISSDYVHALPTIRDNRARVVTLRIKLSSLPLDSHAKDKFLRLVKERYDEKTDIVTITVDRCPLKKQNLDYAQYLITALFHESFVVEDWESTKGESDMERYYWNRNKSKETAESILNWKPDGTDSAVPTAQLEAHDGFATAVENIFNEGEDEDAYRKYKEETLKLLKVGAKS